jgi:acetoin utilization deacetylase AcuC-like enzyme
MPTLLFTHPACLEHDPGAGHPECPDRLRAIMTALGSPAFAALGRREARRAEAEELTRVHPADYVRQVLAAVPERGRAYLDGDTALSPGSGEAALRAAGAACAAVDAVATGEAANAFCAVRPPGHHAEPMVPMGFCLFNNAAVAALHARVAHGHQRVAVIDFDVHHGNGTQAAFEQDPGLFYASTHQSPLYPGTGRASETGVGNIVNLPLPPGSDGARFRQAVTGHLLPALDAFKPDFLVISAGFDAHRADPLAQLALEEADYAWVTRELTALAGRHCGGRLVSTLEGGYDLAALAASAAAHVRELMAVS